MRQAKRILLCLMVMTLSYASTLAQDKPTSEANKPQVVLKNINFDKFDLWKKTVEMIAVVEIKSQGVALKLRDVNYKLKLNDNPVGEGKYEELEIPATEKVEGKLPFK